jgi:predicted esterase YcpF (UPF0227 family)
MKLNRIILLHGFNSGPGQKAEEINAYLKEYHLDADYELIAPQLSHEPKEAIDEINRLIEEHHTGSIFVVGTSLGGFYTNYFRAKFRNERVVAHAINPSWRPTQTLLPAKDTVQENFKTGEKWIFTSEYMDQLEEFEHFVLTNLKNYKGNRYAIHLATEDELLNFDELRSYMEENEVNPDLYFYETDHRFGNIKEVMARMLG